MRFTSHATFGARLKKYTQEQVKNEPMLFNCDVPHAFELGGPIIRDFICNLSPDFQQRGVIDTRVHMLMPGWYPCIPGWHHDDVPRSTPTGQPNYQNPEYFAKHCLALVNAEIAPTEFLLGDIEVPEPDISGTVYYQWDNYLEHMGKQQGSRIKAEDRQLIYFDAATFHRGVQAQSTGWRWFGRVSIDTARKATNEIRRQVQVYMAVPNAGW